MKFFNVRALRMMRLPPLLLALLLSQALLPVLGLRRCRAFGTALGDCLSGAVMRLRPESERFTLSPAPSLLVLPLAVRRRGRVPRSCSRPPHYVP